MAKDMYTYNSLGNYTLFSTAQSPGERARTSCPPPPQRDVKYTLLKNPRATARPRPHRRTNLSKSITIGVHKYLIDPNIYKDLMDYIGDIPVTSLQQLQQYIATVRRMTGTVSCNPIFTAVKNNRQYTYLGNAQRKNVFHTSYPHPYQIGAWTNTPIGYLDLIQELSATYNLGLGGVYPNSFFLEVMRNDKTGYTHIYSEMFPDGPASKFGSMIQPLPSLAEFQKDPTNKKFITTKETLQAGKVEYWPIICVVRPESWNVVGGTQKSQLGLLNAVVNNEFDGNGIQNVVKMVYTPIPVESFAETTIYSPLNMDVSQNLYVAPPTNGDGIPNAYDYPIGTNVRFITTNGGMNYNKTFFDGAVRKFNLVQNINYKSLKYNEFPETKVVCD